MSRLGLLILLSVVGTFGQYSRPPPGPPGYSFYGRGSPSTIRPPSGGKPAYSYSGPGGIMGWLGNQMAKLRGPGGPSASASSRAPFPYQKYKQQQYNKGYRGPPPPTQSYGTTFSPNSIHDGGQGQTHIYIPPGSNGMTPQNTIFQVVAPDGSSRYQAAPPPGYENFFGHQGLIQDALKSNGYNGQGQNSYQYQQSAPQGSGVQVLVPQYPQAQESFPVQSQQSYYGRGQQQPQFQQAQENGNMEVIPSKMIAYNKETLSTGHPEYQKAVEGMETAATTNGYPTYYQQFQMPQQEYQGQQVQALDSNLNTFFSGVAPHVAPVYDFPQSQPQQSQMEHQAQASETQYQVQGPPQYSVQEPQGDYSNQYYQQALPPQGQGEGDLETSASSQSPVQIVPGGDAAGNPMFEVIADANAPTFEGGHPFDINQLISMIEPGAQVDAKDIVSQAESEAQEQAGYPQ